MANGNIFATSFHSVPAALQCRAPLYLCRIIIIRVKILFSTVSGEGGEEGLNDFYSISLLTVTTANGIDNMIQYSDLKTAARFGHLRFTVPFVQVWIIRLNAAQTFTSIVTTAYLMSHKFFD